MLLDPALTVTLPANLTAWCGLDAFVHAFEAATNRNAHAGAMLYAHAALNLLTDALETAVKHPADMEARGKVLLGSCYAGIAIDKRAVAIVRKEAPGVILEASGGITIGNVRKFAAAGVDTISVGSLTHSVKAVDFSLLVD